MEATNFAFGQARLARQYVCLGETLTFKVARSVVGAEGQANFAVLRIGSAHVPKSFRGSLHAALISLTLPRASTLNVTGISCSSSGKLLVQLDNASKARALVPIALEKGSSPPKSVRWKSSRGWGGTTRTRQVSRQARHRRLRARRETLREGT